ncbi:ribonuclease J [Rhizobium laguerreae]|uniref:ribonuclease J n=1 Tax=Rhizobium laguerreae TaxID=1076926 RepID=UPI001C8FE618|nr:ribonuclease J [Rhizobium laguerreae]MBY3157202.1 ribonuclease J [Rhizobium laguerreae]
MNWTLYGHKGEWVLVDAGSAFAPRDLPIVDAIFPDPAIIKSILPKLKGLIVTHAHEDHIGAIHRLWPTIECPIYATPFATKCLQSRFEERKTDKLVTVKTFKPGEKIEVGPFRIKTIQMTHSVPECVSLALKTDIGTVFHTGDWKLDPTPLIGRPTDIEAIKRVGRQGVLAMVCDSTNSQRPAKITSEADVYEGFKKVFKDSRGMVVVSCFATNVARLASAMRAAAATGREIAICGRSLIKNEKIARDLGMLKGVPRPLAFSRHLKGLDRREMAIICTGAQGEANAALSKLSTGEDYRLPQLMVGDTIIHSARVIPGNEEDLHAVFARLRMLGAEILEGEYKGSPLHVTGHATSGEIVQMYEMVKPKSAIPVHGNPTHLAAHAALAKGCGIEEVITPIEGGIYAVSRAGVRQVAQINMRLQAELGDEAHSKIPWNEAKVRAAIEQIEAKQAGERNTAEQTARTARM